MADPGPPDPPRAPNLVQDDLETGECLMNSFVLPEIPNSERSIAEDRVSHKAINQINGQNNEIDYINDIPEDININSFEIDNQEDEIFDRNDIPEENQSEKVFIRMHFLGENSPTVYFNYDDPTPNRLCLDLHESHLPNSVMEGILAEQNVNEYFNNNVYQQNTGINVRVEYQETSRESLIFLGAVPREI